MRGEALQSLLIFACVSSGLGLGLGFGDPVAEAQDEVNDAVIFRAIMSSLGQWALRNSQRHNSHRRKRDEEVVCYGEVGCFRDEGPFDYLDMLPSPPEEVGTRFLLYTRKNNLSPHEMSFFNISGFAHSNFNSSNPTKIIIHGFGSSCQRVWAYEMRLALLSVLDCNIICVDWENGAALPNYVRAAVNTRLVGKQVALLVQRLNSQVGSRTQDFHLVGFSLGAHVAGFAGQELRNLSRITGLDPAGPLFEGYDHRARLDASDALFVDVIHSNGDSLVMGGLGAWQPLGHLDFYPNGGRMQKGCTNLFLGAVRDFLWASEGDGRSLCNHRRAYKFFTDSVSSRCPFPAFPCDSYEKFMAGACFPCSPENPCANMGYYADINKGSGVMYLITREEEPFCANQYKVMIESSATPAPVHTYGSIEITLIGALEINETFQITHSAKDSFTSGETLIRLVVPHPAMEEPIKVHVIYTSYQGWIYSGVPRWNIDRIILMNSFGKSLSFCSKGFILQSGVPATLSLLPGECNPHPGPYFLPSSPWHPFNTTSNEIRNYLTEDYNPTPVRPSFNGDLDYYTYLPTTGAAEGSSSTFESTWVRAPPKPPSTFELVPFDSIQVLKLGPHQQVSGGKEGLDWPNLNQLPNEVPSHCSESTLESNGSALIQRCKPIPPVPKPFPSEEHPSDSRKNSSVVYIYPVHEPSSDDHHASETETRVDDQKPPLAEVTVQILPPHLSAILAQLERHGLAPSSAALLHPRPPPAIPRSPPPRSPPGAHSSSRSRHSKMAAAPWVVRDASSTWAGGQGHAAARVLHSARSGRNFGTPFQASTSTSMNSRWYLYPFRAQVVPASDTYEARIIPLHRATARSLPERKERME